MSISNKQLLNDNTGQELYGRYVNEKLDILEDSNTYDDIFAKEVFLYFTLLPM